MEAAALFCFCFTVSFPWQVTCEWVSYSLYDIAKSKYSLYALLQLKVVNFRLEMEMVYPIFWTTEIVVVDVRVRRVSRTIELLLGIKPLSPATSLSVIKCVGTSQSGGWMSTQEVIDIRMNTLLTSKCGDHHPLWMTPLVLDATAWLETTGLPLFLWLIK